MQEVYGVFLPTTHNGQRQNCQLRDWNFDKRQIHAFLRPFLPTMHQAKRLQRDSLNRSGFLQYLKTNKIEKPNRIQQTTLMKRVQLLSLPFILHPWRLPDEIVDALVRLEDVGDGEQIEERHDKTPVQYPHWHTPPSFFVVVSSLTPGPMSPAQHGLNQRNDYSRQRL